MLVVIVDGMSQFECELHLDTYWMTTAAPLRALNPFTYRASVRLYNRLLSYDASIACTARGINRRVRTGARRLPCGPRRTSPRSTRRQKQRDKLNAA
jgi:hypothetical protein